MDTGFLVDDFLRQKPFASPVEPAKFQHQVSLGSDGRIRIKYSADVERATRAALNK